MAFGCFFFRLGSLENPRNVSSPSPHAGGSAEPWRLGFWLGSWGVLKAGASCGENAPNPNQEKTLPSSKLTWLAGNPPVLIGYTSSNGGFSMAMLVYWRVIFWAKLTKKNPSHLE